MSPVRSRFSRRSLGGNSSSSLNTEFCKLSKDQPQAKVPQAFHEIRHIFSGTKKWLFVNDGTVQCTRVQFLYEPANNNLIGL